MKKEIHPVFFPKAETVCACGAKYNFGSTKENLAVEICAVCHPFYTGNDKVIDTAGRVEKFKARREASSKKKASK